MAYISSESVEYSPLVQEQENFGWFRTGLTGIAYRFGRLCVSKSLALVALSAVFYLV